MSYIFMGISVHLRRQTSSLSFCGVIPVLSVDAYTMVDMYLQCTDFHVEYKIFILVFVISLHFKYFNHSMSHLFNAVLVSNRCIVYTFFFCSKWPLEHAWLGCRTLCNSWPVLHESSWQKEMGWYNKCNTEHKLHCRFFLKARPGIYQQCRSAPTSKEQDEGMCELYISGLHCYNFAQVFSFLLHRKYKNSCTLVCYSVTHLFLYALRMSLCLIQNTCVLCHYSSETVNNWIF